MLIIGPLALAFVIVWISLPLLIPRDLQWAARVGASGEDVVMTVLSYREHPQGWRDGWELGFASRARLWRYEMRTTHSRLLELQTYMYAPDRAAPSHR